MDRTEKNAKRNTISKAMEIGKSRFKDSEIELLYKVTTKPDVYNGVTKTRTTTKRGISSDGKYQRKEQYQYTIRNDEDGVRIEREYHFRDDDGMSGGDSDVVSSARGILEILNNIFDAFIEE